MGVSNRRCLTRLAIDVFFNTISVWLQVMLFNIAVLRVWNSKKWRSHAIANIVCTVLIFFVLHRVPLSYS